MTPWQGHTVKVIILSLLTALPPARADKLKALAVTTKMPSRLMPELPRLKVSGAGLKCQINCSSADLLLACSTKLIQHTQ